MGARKGWAGLPNPGSPEAETLGCRCPRMDNNHGKWAPWPPDGWWIIAGCPVHAPDDDASDGGVDGAAPSPNVVDTPS